MDDDDLYQDLDVPASAVATHELKTRLQAAQGRITTLEQKAALVGKECVSLRKENEVLRVNNSSLYNTAKRELGRKYAELVSLREQVRALGKQLQGGGGGGGGGR